MLYQQYLQFLFNDPIDSNFYLIDAYRFEAIKDTYNLSTRLSERLIFDKKIILANGLLNFKQDSMNRYGRPSLYASS